jgi:hypothetical protein
MFSIPPTKNSALVQFEGAGVIEKRFFGGHEVRGGANQLINRMVDIERWRLQDVPKKHFIGCRTAFKRPALNRHGASLEIRAHVHYP